MAVDAEARLTITTEETTVSALCAGDLVHVGYPLPHPQVVSNEPVASRLAPNRRSRVTLVDSQGVEKQFRLSPRRRVKRVTNPAIPVGPWNTPEEIGLRIDVSQEVAAWQRVDALWHKALAPLGRPFARLWRGVLDLRCRAYSLRMRAGFFGILIVIVAAAIGIATRTEPEQSVAVSIVGAFIAERCWEFWRRRSRRRLAKGISMRVRYKPFGPDEMRYGTLRVTKTGAVILDPEQTSIKPWSSTELHLYQGNQRLATCVFANDIRGDLSFTCRKIAEAIRHRIDDGSDRVVYATSTNYDPERDSMQDIVLFPNRQGFEVHIADKETQRRFSLSLKFHQARVLADALEVMDDMRRL